MKFLANWGEAIYQYRKEYYEHMFHLEELPTEETNTVEKSTVCLPKTTKEMRSGS